VSGFVSHKTVHHQDRVLARSVFLVCLAVFTATFVGPPDNPDAEVEFQTTSALVRTGRLALGGTPEADAIVQARFDVREGGPGREGRFYSWFGVGQALVGVPFYVLGSGVERLFPAIEERHRATTRMGAGRSEYFQHLFVGWRNPLLAALTVHLLMLSARRLGASRRSAWLGALGYGLCTYAWPQARSTLSDVQATFLLFLAFHLLLYAREAYGRGKGRPRVALGFAGLSLGLAFLTRLVTAPAIAVLLVAAWFVVRRGRRQRAGGRLAVTLDLATLAAPALAGLAAFLVVNQLRFGDPLESGYSDAVGSGTFFSYPPWLGLLGLLIAPGKGLVWMAPALLLAPLGITKVWRAGGRVWPLTVAGMAVAVAGPIVPLETWHGAWTYGPRYVLPLVPFLWLGTSLAFDEVAPQPWGRALARGLLVLGLAVSLPGVLVDHMTHQDLALQASRVAWPEMPGDDEAQRDSKRFVQVQWDPRFAAPWAHWRILRHRAALGDEAFPAREIFFLDDDAVLTPEHERDRGFRHLAWIDFTRRLRGEVWPAALACILFLGAGLMLTFRGFESGGH
jgi:hypothetical protein